MKNYTVYVIWNTFTVKYNNYLAITVEALHRIDPC